MTPKQGRKERMYSESEIRGLSRALRIERAARKIYERQLRELLPPHAYEEAKRNCQAESMARCQDEAGQVTARGEDA